MALTGKQKKLDKDGDGKISGKDFKMMKARYGTMAKGNVSQALKKEKVKKSENQSTRIALLKKMRGAQVGVSEEASVSDMSMSEMKKKLATYNNKKMYKGGDFKMMKAKVGKMINDTEELGRVDSEKAYTSKGKKNLKGEKKRLVKEIKKDKKMMKARHGSAVSTRGYGAARTSGMGLQDESFQSGETYVVRGGDYIKDLL